MDETMSRGPLLAAGSKARRRLNHFLLPLRYYVMSRRCERNGVANGLPVPPRELTFLVGGGYNLERNLKNGILSAGAIRRSLSKNGLALEDFHDILDFGCGPGRILRNWGHLQANVYGTDYNRKSIEWCEKNLSFATFAVNDLEPPTSWPDAKFDFIYAFSVFTHLGEDLQRAWLSELRRILRVGGYLMLTIHGQAYFGTLSPAEQKEFSEGLLVVQGQSKAGTNSCGVYHPEAWIRRNLTEGFQVVDHIPEGATGTGTQDILLLQKR